MNVLPPVFKTSWWQSQVKTGDLLVRKTRELQGTCLEKKFPPVGQRGHSSRSRPGVRMGGPGPQPGSPLSMKVSARTQTPLTATTKSAIDREAQACMETYRSHLVNFWAAPDTHGTGDHLVLLPHELNQLLVSLRNSYKFLKVPSLSLQGYQLRCPSKIYYSKSVSTMDNTQRV